MMIHRSNTDMSKNMSNTSHNHEKNIKHNKKSAIVFLSQSLSPHYPRKKKDPCYMSIRNPIPPKSIKKKIPDIDPEVVRRLRPMLVRTRHGPAHQQNAEEQRNAFANLVASQNWAKVLGLRNMFNILLRCIEVSYATAKDHGFCNCLGPT